jgi:signal transduction histidine kinase
LSRFWNAYFGVVWLVTVVIVALSGRRPWALAGAEALLVALAVWYLGYGRRLGWDDPPLRGGLVFFAGVLVLLPPAVWLSSSSSYLLFALTPLAFILLPLRPAIAMAVGLDLLPSAILLARTGNWALVLGGTAPFAILAGAFAVVFGTTLVRVIVQNEERRALIEELAATRAEVARLSHEAGAAKERARLAADIHDTVAQGLSSMAALLQAAEAELDRDTERARTHLRLATRTARDNLSEVRALVADLTPGELRSSTLADTIGRLAERFAAETGARASHAVTGTPRPLPTGLEVVLLRAAQEALANVRKHAGAVTVELCLTYRADTVVLAVRDDGRGFDPGQDTGGYGLAAMRSRVSQVGGELRITCPPGEGTALRVEVPA